MPAPQETPRPQPTGTIDRSFRNPFAKGGIARTTLAGLAALTGAQMFDAACTPTVPGVGGPNPIQVNPDTNPALATAAAQAEQREATAQAGLPPTVSTVAEAGKQTEAPTTAATAAPAETKKEQPCIVLPLKYCKEVKQISYKVGDKSYTFIGINFPPGVRVPLYAGESGHLYLTVEDGKTFFGKGAKVETAAGEVLDARGNIDTSQWGNLMDIGHVNAGDPIGFVETSPNKSLQEFDFVFTITRAGEKGVEVVDEKLRSLFKE